MTILLIQGNGGIRRKFREDLERHALRVVVVGAVSDAAARARASAFTIVVNTNLQRSVHWWEDHTLLAERRSLLLRETGRFELYLPAPGIHARGILVMPGDDPQALRSIIALSLERLRETDQGTTPATDAPLSTT
jgi:hypothetical protein